MIAGLSGSQLAQRLRTDGIALRTGPFAVRVRSGVESVCDGLLRLYGDVPVLDDSLFCDFEVVIQGSSGLRRWVRPQARFLFDGASAFEPLPLAHAFPMFEWAMNWCISTHVNQFLLIHSAVVERNGFAAILPAPPGSGKSTLCAALIHRGWRLLSDEIALVPFDGSGIRPLARPVSLKNESIALIQAFAPQAVLNTPTPNTAKGTVTHMRVPTEHMLRVDEAALPGWIVFPRWQQGAQVRLERRSKAQTLIDLARNSFNFGVLGALGFDTAVDMVTRCDCLDFVYGRLDDAIAAFDALSERHPAGGDAC